MNSIFKLLLKIGLGLIVILLVGVIALKITFNEDIPQGISGPAADNLALKMLEAIEYDDFKEVKELQWTFRGVNHYVWRPQNDQVQVSWDNLQVDLNTTSPSTSKVTQDGELLMGDNASQAIDYAVTNFNNDSFWLVAPFKVMDPGTQREVIEENNTTKLLVRYTNGGSTPGDVYVWELDKNYVPKSFKMWVQIIPLDGLEASWDNWEMTDGGFLLSMKKSIYGIDIPITNVSVK